MTARHHAALVLAAALAAPLGLTPVAAAAPGYAQNAPGCADASACGGCNACQPGACEPGGCLGGPTPGPCTADGVCYPRVLTWGHYQGRWGRWPGDYEDPLPEGPRSRDEVTIPGPPDIRPADEDKEAPPAADDEPAEGDEDEAAESERPTVGDDLPPLPPPRGLGPPPVGGDDDDPPPAFPGFNAPAGGAGPGLLDGFSARPIPAPAPRPAPAPLPAAPRQLAPRPLRQVSTRPVDQDLPPALPAELQALSRQVRHAAAYNPRPGYVTPIGAVAPAAAYATPAGR